MPHQRKFGLVEFLQQQLIRKDKEIEIGPDEVLDKIEALLETMLITEEALVITEFTPPYKWADGAVPAAERLVWNISEWS